MSLPAESHLKSATAGQFRGLIRAGLALLAGSVVLVLLVRRVSLEEIGQALAGANLRRCSLAILIGLLPTAMRTVRYSCCFPPRGRWVELYGVFAFNRLLNYVLPLRSGELVCLNMLKKRGLSPSIAATAPSWIFLRAVDFAAVSFWLAVVLGLTSTARGFQANFAWMAGGLLAGSAVLVIGVLLMPVLVRTVPTRWLGGWLARRLEAVRDGVRMMPGAGSLVGVLAVSVTMWASLLAHFAVAQAGFSPALSAADSLFVAAVVLAVSTLPIRAPMNLGTGDAAWTGIMMLAGADARQAITVAIGVRIVQMIVTLFDGLIGFCLLTVKPRSAIG